MFNIQKQIDYWRNRAMEDYEVAKNPIDQKKVRHGLFFAHLALEKMLKAHVVKRRMIIHRKFIICSGLLS